MIAKRKQGFSLVEMVMVVTIVAVIAAVMIPAVQNQREQSKIAMTKANLEHLRTLIEIYYDEEGEYPHTALMDLVDKGYIDEIPAEGIMMSNYVHDGIVDSWGCDGTSGGWCWEYNFPDEFSVNLSGNDANGDPYTSY